MRITQFVNRGPRRIRLLLPCLLATAAMSLVSTTMTAAPLDNFQLVRPVPLPNGLPITQIDIGWVDQYARVYVLADGTNASIDMIDLTTGALTVIQPAGAGKFQGKPFDPNSPARNEVTGPNGATIVNHAEIWAGDAPSLAGPLVLSSNLVTAYANDNCDSSVKVISLVDLQVTDVINTGGCFRADELAHDPVDQVVLIANPSELPIGKGPSLPFITLISSAPVPFGKTHPILKQINFDGTNGTPNAVGGIEQPAWSPVTGMFYIAVPQNGPTDTGGVVAVVDPVKMQVVKLIPLTKCAPNGIAIGPGTEAFMGCTGTNPVQVIDYVSGNVIKIVPQVVGCDEVYYNAGNNRFVGACKSSLAVINANPVVFEGQIAGITHSIAADPVTNTVYVPIPSTNHGLCGATGQFGCIGIFGFATTNAVVSPTNLTTSQNSVEIDGAASTSAAGGLSYTYAALSGGLAATIFQNGANPNVIVQFNKGPGIYNLQLTVTDGNGATSVSPVVKITYTGL
jgi:hypothetical protein